MLKQVFPRKYNFFFAVLNSYLGYTVFQVFVFSVLMSFFAFFHFQLDHNFSLIEQWSRFNCWEILITTKVLATFISLYFQSVQYDGFHFPGDYFKILFEGERRYEVSIISLIFLVFSFLLMNINIDLLISGSLYELLLISISVFCFYLCDGLFISLKLKLLGLKGSKLQKLLLCSLLAFIFFIISDYLIPFQKQTSLIVFINIFTIFFVLMFVSSRIDNLFPYIFIFILPVGLLQGLNPLERSGVHYLFGANFNITYLVIIWLQSLVYLYVKSEQKLNVRLS